MNLTPVYITSNQNGIVKEVKALKSKKFRDEKALYFIEGLRFIEEALKAHAPIVEIILSDSFYNSSTDSEIMDKLINCEAQKFVVTDKLFSEISDTENPQGILAVVKTATYSIEELATNNGFILILDSIQDPGNMGTIIRTADAAGVDGVIMTKGCVDLYNPKVLRATMGSIFHLPVYRSEDIITTIKMLKQQGCTVYAAHLDGVDNYFNMDMQRKIAIIIGNEANGIGVEVAGAADYLVKIPIRGSAESLNAAIAASLMMYEAVRQRSGE